MSKDQFAKQTGTSRKLIATNIVLIANAYLWYFYAFDYLRRPESLNTSFNTLSAWGANFFGIAAAAIVSALLVERFRSRLRFLRLWMLAGLLLSFAPTIYAGLSDTGVILASAILGAYFGFGMPVCMGYFASSTGPEGRARLGGITMLCVGIGVFAYGNLGVDDAFLTSAILFATRLSGLVILALLKPEEKYASIEAKISYKSVLSYRPFLLYLIPWMMFSLVNDMTYSVKTGLFPTNPDFVHYSGIMANILGGIFAVLSGFFADNIGRKRLTVTGFALLGMAYGVLGFSSEGNMFAWWFYTAVDGIAWGVFITIFLMTVWGDLAQSKNSEKFYAIGSLPYLLSNFSRLTLGIYVAEAIETTHVFSFASLFLFLAVLPLVFAPETLSEKVMKARELKTYLEKARKIALRSQDKQSVLMQKEDDSCQEEPGDGVEFEVKQEDLEEAEQLAQKYY